MLRNLFLFPRIRHDADGTLPTARLPASHGWHACTGTIDIQCRQFLKRIIVRVDKSNVSVTPSQFEMISKTLDATALRHKVISQNIANVNTPGYRAREVSFEGMLKRSLQNNAGNLDDADPLLQDTAGLESRIDGNNVDLDREIAELNKNSIMYETYTQLLATKISIMRSAITGR